MHNDFLSQPCPEDARQLDLEFRQILSAIKQFVPYVDSNARLSLYRSWLEKLSCTNSDKRERNRYLVELARQIRENRVLPPFDQRPPIGHLKSFPENDDCSGDESKANQVHLNYPNFTFQISEDFENPMPPINTDTQSNVAWRSLNIPIRPRKRIEDAPASLLTGSFANGGYFVPKKDSRDSKRGFQTARGAFEGTCDDTRTMERDDLRAVPTKISDGVREESSWCDLTDTSATSIVANSMDRGDAAAAAERTTNENAELRIADSDEVERDDTVEIASKTPDNLHLDPKYGLKDTHFISADWKKTIESLQMRLTETLSQNNELKSALQALQAQTAHDHANKEPNEAQQRRNAKELEQLRKAHGEQLAQLQQSFEFRTGRLAEDYELRMEEVKAAAELRVRELKVEYEDEKREKDREIYRLSDIIQQQCIRMSNEIVALRKQIESSLSITNNNNSNNNNNVPGEQVFVLQKCVSKMDKLFHKSEKDYMKQIEKLKQEIELKDKVAQIQLRTQRAELISRTNADRQKQIEDVVNNLEVKYIKMLEYHENQVSESKKQDEEKIEYLKDLLEKNNITFVI